MAWLMAALGSRRQSHTTNSGLVTRATYIVLHYFSLFGACTHSEKLHLVGSMVRQIQSWLEREEKPIYLPLFINASECVCSA